MSNPSDAVVDTPSMLAADSNIGRSRYSYEDKTTSELNHMPNGRELGPSSQISITVEELARIVQITSGHRPVPAAPPSGLGNPGPLGLGAFATTTFVLSVFNAGVFIDADVEHVVLPLALTFGGIAQFIAGLYEYRIPNTFGATAFCAYGAFWVAFAALVQFVVPNLDSSQTNDGIGLFLLGWTIFTFYMTIAAYRVSRAVFAVFILLFPTFLLLTIGKFTDSNVTTQVGGFFGIVTAIAAWYASAAVVINSTWGRTLLPIGVLTPKKKTQKGV